MIEVSPVRVFCRHIPIILTFLDKSVRSKDSSAVDDSGAYSNSAVPSMELPESVELLPTQTPAEDSARVSYDSMTFDSEPLPERPGDALCVRIQHLCNHDFRDKPWYLENLFLIISYAIMGAWIILVFPFLGSGSTSGLLTFAVPIVIGCSFPIFAIIPLCGIVSSIQRRKRRPPWLIRLAIDSTKKYRVCRWLFFLCAPISGLAFGISVAVSANMMITYLLLLWAMVCGAILFYAGFRGLVSIYLQVLPSKSPRDDTRCDQ